MGRNARFQYEESVLYHLLEDPKERNNLIHQHPDEAHRLTRAFGSYFGLRILWVAGPIEPNGIQGKYELASGSVDI
jgi:hypothetical protein